MTKENRRSKVFFIAGMAVGIAAVIAVTVLFQFNPESRGLMGTIQAFLFYGFPVAAGLAAGWKNPLIGGVILIVYGGASLTLFSVMIFTTPTSQSFWELLREGPLPLLAVMLPPIISGVLLILSRRSGRREP